MWIVRKLLTEIKSLQIDGVRCPNATVVVGQFYAVCARRARNELPRRADIASPPSPTVLHQSLRELAAQRCRQYKARLPPSDNVRVRSWENGNCWEELATQPLGLRTESVYLPEVFTSRLVKRLNPCPSVRPLITKSGFVILM